MKKLKNKVFWVICIILTFSLISFLVIYNSQAYTKEYSEVNSCLMRMNGKPNDNKIPSFLKERSKNERLITNSIEIENYNSSENINDTSSNTNNVFGNNFNTNSQNKTNENSVDKGEIILEDIEEEIEVQNPIEVNDNKIFIDINAYTIKFDDNGNIISVINHTESDIDENSLKEIANKIMKSKKTNKYIGNLLFENYSYNYDENQKTLTIIDNSEIKSTLQNSLRTSCLIFLVLEILIILITRKITNWIIKPVMESFNKQKQFIADASHELKTPLAVIMASAEALENDPKENKWLRNIKSESNRMSELITNLLDLAKTESDKNYVYEECNLSKTIEMQLLTFESLIFEEGLKLDYQIDENILFSCDVSQMKQLVSILIDNGIKHCDKDGLIKVKLHKEKGNIVLEVTNQGKEIPKEEREKIFERFYRGDVSRNRNNNRYGLGLAIAKNIVNIHKGKIFVDCKDGFTTFKVILKCN